MSHLSASELFAIADERGQRALPCFDVAGGNADILFAICEELAATGACAFVSSTPQSIADYLGLEQFSRSITAARDRFGVAIAAHLDHATDPESVLAALDAGIRSVMYDGSALPLAANVSASERLRRAAHEMGATLETEVGTISGKEDPGEPLSGRNAAFEDVSVFVAAVEPDLLAPAIGTIHGRRGGDAEIDWDLAGDVAALFGDRVVLHGTTGLPLEDVNRLVAMGYRKVNYATAVRDSFVAGVENAIVGSTERPRPQALLAAARNKVGRFVASTLRSLEG